MTTRAIVPILLALTLLLGAACSRVEQQNVAESGMVIVEGIGRAEATPSLHTPGGPLARTVYFQRLRKNLPDWADYSLKATASVPIPEEASSPVLALTVARQAARDQTIEDLMVELRPFSDKGEGSVGDLMDADPAVAWRVREAVRNGTRFSSNPTEAQDNITVAATLPLESVALAIWGPDPGTPVRISLPKQRNWWWPFAGRVYAPEDPMQRIAFENAVIDARQKVLQQIRDVRLFEETSIAARMMRDPEIADAVYDALDTMHVVDILTPRPDVCHITVRVDIEDLVADLRD